MGEEASPARESVQGRSSNISTTSGQLTVNHQAKVPKEDASAVGAVFESDTLAHAGAGGVSENVPTACHYVRVFPVLSGNA